MMIPVGPASYQPERIFCVGMNYLEHIRELNNRVPDTPVIFMKPSTCLLAPGNPIPYPSHGRELHYETEVVVLIGSNGRPSTPQEARRALAAIGLGLDMTLRDLQKSLRKEGNPWELCKAFEGSAPLSSLVPVTPGMDLANLSFTGSVNGTVRQRGTTSDLVFPILDLVQYLSTIWTLRQGDLIFTGTPVGVGPVDRGDRLQTAAPWCGTTEWCVA